MTRSKCMPSDKSLRWCLPSTADVMHQATGLVMDLFMSRIFWIMILVWISPGSARAGEGGLSTYLQYTNGSPIVLHLNYPGGITQWDAGASIANETLILSNAMIISVTNIKGESVKPIEGKVLVV